MLAIGLDDLPGPQGTSRAPPSASSAVRRRDGELAQAEPAVIRAAPGDAGRRGNPRVSSRATASLVSRAFRNTPPLSTTASSPVSSRSRPQTCGDQHPTRVEWNRRPIDGRRDPAAHLAGDLDDHRPHVEDQRRLVAVPSRASDHVERIGAVSG